MALNDGLEAGGGIEPPIEDLQSPALPLCYPADPLSSAKPEASAPARAWQSHGTGLLQSASHAVNGACADGRTGRIRPVADCRAGSSPL